MGKFNEGRNPGRQVFIQPNIGLNSEVRHSVVNLLNRTLANETVLAIKTRSAQWNVQGVNYFDLHTLFSTQYLLLNNLCDEIAERIRIFGGCAIGSLGEFLETTQLEDQPGSSLDTLHLLADHEASIRILREDTRKCLEEYEDAGTFEILVSAMRLHEKMAWILRSHMDKDPVDLESQVFSQKNV